MLTYLLRRLLLMIPTLLGISFVTLGLIHLAPGDPVQAQTGGLQAGKGGLSKEEIEAMRRTYFLHLPIILNFTPEDARTVNAALLTDATSDDEKLRDRSIRRVAQRGAITLAAAATRLDEVEGAPKAALLSGLAEMAPRLGIEAELKAAADPTVFWRSYVSSHEAELNPEGAQQAVQDYLTRGDAEAQAALYRLDTLALEPAFAALFAAGWGSPEARRLMDFLSHATGTDISIREGDDEKTITRAHDSWRRWWQTRRADYVEFEGLERLGAVFTETQYAKWVYRIATLDFGISSRDQIPVKDKLWDRLQRTLLLAVLALTVSYVLAIPLGVYSAVRQYTTTDKVLSLVLFILYSLPSFWVAMLMQTWLCGGEGWNVFPLTGLVSDGWETLSLPAKIGDLAWHLALPIFCLTYDSLASLSRYQRVGMLDVIRMDYIRTARAKGLSERVVVFKHAMRNSVIPIITLMGLQLPFLVSGAVIIEMIFQIPGMGLETLEAIRTRDLNWIMASVTLTAVMTMFGILMSDVIYALIDPRIQVGARAGD